MDVLPTGDGLPDDEPWFEFDITPPASLTADDFHMIPISNLAQKDRRLSDYHARILVSPPTPDDPSGWPYCVIEGSDGQPLSCRLWRLWIRYQQVPMIGELRYEHEYGWMEVIYHPLWFQQRATVKESEKTSRGLAILLDRIQRPGRPRQQGPTHETREEWQHVIQQARDRLQRRGISGKPAVAKQLGVPRSTFYLVLSRFPGLWEATETRP